MIKTNKQLTSRRNAALFVFITGGLIKIQKKKYGLWETRYAENSRNIFEDWVRQRNGEPVLFSTELGALEYMHGIEMQTQSVFTEFEVREVV